MAKRFSSFKCGQCGRLFDFLVNLEQHANQYHPTRWFKVTVKVAGRSYGTFKVQAADEWAARTTAMFSADVPSGSHVEYEVKEA